MSSPTCDHGYRQSQNYSLFTGIYDPLRADTMSERTEA